MKVTPRRQVAKVTTRPATVKGLNAYDSIVEMPEGFALVLRNLFAQPYGCQVRRGYRQHVTGLLGKVETVASHNKAGGNKLYAFVKPEGTGIDASLFDVTEPTLIPPPPALPAVIVPIATGLTNARWQHINFANAAGVHLLACNGADDLVWIQPNDTLARIASGDGSVNTISGVDPKALVHIYSHQKRIWFVEKNSSRGWYLPPDQLYGIASSFDFGGYWTKGGYLQQIITWTIDDGEGADDHLVAISSEGQISVFKGTDVEGADTWTLAGVYYAGSPVGRRTACRYGGDVLIMTQNGIVFLSQLLKSTKVNPAQDSDARYIQQIVSAAVSATGDLFGWQPFVFPAANMLIVNVPATETNSYQLVMNDITKAWSEFLGYEAYCWELHDELPIFGSFGAVYRAWEGTTDDSYIVTDTSTDPDTTLVVQGNDIRAEVQSTFNYFGSLGVQKHFKMVRPTLLSRGAFSINFAVNTDFVFDSPTAPGAFSFVKPGIWDEDYWDSAVWEGGLTTYKTWQAVQGIGTAASIRMLIRSRQETYWASTDWLYEDGGIM
jgi:hypothetical protein